ncbi:hypothetical protein CEXT_345111, partial [Caerostris extrusa]
MVELPHFYKVIKRTDSIAVLNIWPSVVSEPCCAGELQVWCKLGTVEWFVGKLSAVAGTSAWLDDEHKQQTKVTPDQ